MILKKKDTLESSSKRAKNIPRDSQEFARRMIIDGIMSLEMVSKLSGLSMAVVQELAAKITLNSKEVVTFM